MAKSAFIFRPHKYAEGESRIHGLVDVYSKETGDHLGMLNPHRDGGYMLRNREGELLSANNGGRIEDTTYVSRETSARILSVRIRQYDAMMSARTGSVSEGCPNNWHNTSAYRADTACPECPSQVSKNFVAEMVPTTGIWEVRSTSSDWSTSFGRDQAAAERFADRMNDKTKAL